MINKSELRLGNWVFGHDPQSMSYGVKKYFQVDEISEDGINCWRVEGFDSEYATFDPIPLTPKVLLAAGFGLSEFQNRMVITYENNKFDIWLYYYKEKCIYSSSCFPDGAKPINYLHQLQNLYFALTGTELEIDITKL